ncbi:MULTISPECIES: universal stress protein [unclassified Isoptericola]|uniref:universal stress protein n=1 Tax=unclassified Isoptericola TaxID=2623355 RepID=UPI00271382A2|nr:MULTISPECIES: universal stress protein [unclassified Isoptericola]MDO8147192.1 universal stress protein [Isoptericola sp. b515]MDO8150495.1 universal stress protein [Isoptericola sp. b408]
MDGIVVGVNGSVEADEALDWAAAEAMSARLPLVVVMVARERDEESLGAVLAEREAEAAEILGRARERHGGELEAEVRVVHGPEPEALMAAADDAEMLVLGRRRRNRLGRRLLGSVSTTVVEHSRIPVTVVRRPEDGDQSGPDQPSDRPRVVAGVDTSGHSVAALVHAARVAARLGAVLEPVFAWQITTLAPLPGSWGWAPPIDDYERFARERLEDVIRAVELPLSPDRVRPRVVHGQAAKVLIEASAGADRIVVGTRGLGGFDRLVLGSTARQVLDYASSPVTVLHG